MTHGGVKGDDPDSLVGESHGQKPRSLFSMRNGTETHAHHVRHHLLPLSVLVELSRLCECSVISEGVRV